MRLLLNAAGDPAPGPLDDEALTRLYRHPQPHDRPWVRANFVSTLDGAAQGEDGRSGTINTASDRAVFQLMRALTDVVLVGAGTARVEGYKPPVTSKRWRAARAAVGHETRHPAMAVVTRSGDVPPLLSEQRESAGDVYLLTCDRAPGKAVELAREALGDDRVVVTGGDSVDLPDALQQLATRGLGRVLCEGGPHLTHDLVASGALDELCLTLSPKLIAGEHLRVLAGPDLDLDLVPWTLIEADATLIGRWVRSDRTDTATA
ncbi:MAG TPA: pyrimidine reductase family protein [Segeticoccus sp.]|uniref:pyrimidine reductase family protein n=1 Tax=Segeticoccus sp. TaxID=2706531 RepID=UPI002D7E7F0A|nr:pyrimidine reductase family protein [Segeticoccus sp.]HET8600536.1 pyrimidine reductase family protein [Segeticoccus sp.]